MKKATDLDPFSAIVYANLGSALNFARRYDEGIAHLKNALEIDPNLDSVKMLLPSAYEQQENYEQAISAWERAPHSSLARWSLQPQDLVPLRQAHAASGARGYWQKRLEFARQHATEGYVPPLVLAGLCARAGDKDEAFQWLEKAYQNRDESLRFLKVHPFIDSLRSDPRYADLVRRVGLAP